MESIEFAPSLGIPEILPVGSAVASACKAGFLDEGLQQYRSIRIPGVPVVGQAFTDQGQDARGQIPTLDPRQDKEARVVDDQVQIATALFAGPADALITRFDFPGTGAKTESRDDFTGRAHEVAQLRSRQELMAKVVMPFNVGIPQQRVAFVHDRIDIQLSKVYARTVAWRKYRPLYVWMHSIRGGFEFSRRWQGDEAVN
jgi:hypothetical protein